VASAFAGVAADLEAARGRRFLVEAVVNLIRPPLGIEPTDAHLRAVTLFDQIVTTNYDGLFEEALRRRNREAVLIVEELAASALPERTVVKLHGSAAKPESLLLTERDVFLFDRTRPKLWQAAVDLLRKKQVVVLGSSLKDPSIVRLFSEVGPDLSGWFVVPSLWQFAPAWLRPWNLECVTADADSFLEELEQRVAAATP
jgi:hypothetical protein